MTAMADGGGLLSPQLRSAALLLFCVGGIYASYLTQVGARWAAEDAHVPVCPASPAAPTTKHTLTYPPQLPTLLLHRNTTGHRERAPADERVWA
jgi:hypothetical protein